MAAEKSEVKAKMSCIPLFSCKWKIEQLLVRTLVHNNQPSHLGHQWSCPCPVIGSPMPRWRRWAAFVVITTAKWNMPRQGLWVALDKTAGSAWRDVIKFVDESYLFSPCCPRHTQCARQDSGNTSGEDLNTTKQSTIAGRERNHNHSS